MELGIQNLANNFGYTAGLLSNTLANRPAMAALGTIFYSTDTLQIFRYTGTTWVEYGAGGGGGITGADNGLSVVGTEVYLGGTLLGSTQVVLDVNSFTFAGDNFGADFFIDPVNYLYAFGRNNVLDTGLNINIDGNLYLLYTQYLTYQTGIYLDYGNISYKFGHIDGVGVNTFIKVETDHITTNYDNDIAGLDIDFRNRVYRFGDFQNNDYYISIDAANNIWNNYFNGTYRIGGNTRSGLEAGSTITLLGDWSGNYNSTTFGVDDDIEMLIGSGNLLTGSASGNSGQHLKVNIGGTDYVIELKNP